MLAGATDLRPKVRPTKAHHVCRLPRISRKGPYGRDLQNGYGSQSMANQIAKDPKHTNVGEVSKASGVSDGVVMRF